MGNHSHTFLYRLTKIQYINRWIIFFVDILLSMVATSFTLALLHMIYGEQLYPFDKVIIYTVLAIPASAASFLLFATYKGIIRHSSISEAGRLSRSEERRVGKEC